MTIAYVLLIGLISFTRSSDGVAALLVDSVGPQQASDGCPIPRHDGVLVVSAEDVEESDECPDEAGWSLLMEQLLAGVQRMPYERALKDGRPAFCSWRLRREEVRFLREETSEAFSGEICDAGDNDCPALMRDLESEHLVLRKECLDPKPVNCPLDGRVILPVQKIQAKSACGNPLKFEPLRGKIPKPLETMAGDMALAEVVSSGVIKIQIRNFGNITQGRTITLKGEKPWVLVFHGALHDHAKMPPACVGDVDHHFEMYYRLTEQRPSSYRRPVPQGYCPDPCYRLEDRSERFRSVLGIDLSLWIKICMFGVHERIICPMSTF